LRIPRPKNTTKIALLIGGVGVLIAGSVAARLGWVLFLEFKLGVMPLADVRFGAMIFVIMLLLSILARDYRAPPLLSTLIDVRRNLGLSTIPYNAARSQTEIALRDDSIGSLLREAEEVLEDMRDIHSQLAIVHDEVKASILAATYANQDPTQVSTLLGS
jgi:hypothetical protein